MKIIYNNIIPFPGYKILNFFGILFVRKGSTVGEIDLNHEKIHTAQMKEMLYIGFYLWYLIEYVITRIASWFDQSYAYHDISFEEEAYLNERNLEYLKTRKHYSWFKYIKIGSWEKKKK